MKIIEFNLHLLCNSVHYMTWHWQVKNADFELKTHTHTLALALWGVFSEYFGDTKYNLTKICMWIYACVFFLENPTRKDLYANLSLVQMSPPAGCPVRAITLLPWAQLRSNRLSRSYQRQLPTGGVQRASWGSCMPRKQGKGFPMNINDLVLDCSNAMSHPNDPDSLVRQLL